MEELTNYTKEKLTIDLVWANVFAILTLVPIIIVFGLPYYLVWGLGSSEFMDSIMPIDIAFGSFYAFGCLIIGIIIHELIHGLSWVGFTKNGFKSIKFGVLWKMLTPYCHCKEPLKVKHYIFGAITPAIILGILPAIIAIGIGSFGLLSFGMFFTMAAAGDFLIINLIRKENWNDLVQDHPSEAGCYIYRKIKE